MDNGGWHVPCSVLVSKMLNVAPDMWQCYNVVGPAAIGKYSTRWVAVLQCSTRCVTCSVYKCMYKCGYNSVYIKSHTSVLVQTSVWVVSVWFSRTALCVQSCTYYRTKNVTETNRWPKGDLEYSVTVEDDQGPGKDGRETDWDSWPAEAAPVEGGLASRGAVEVALAKLFSILLAFHFHFHWQAEEQ